MLKVTYEDHKYTIDNKDNILIISIDGIEKSFKLKEEYRCDYVYQIKKTFIKCHSIEQLMDHFKDCIEKDFALEVWCIDPINRIFNYTKSL